jgi:hypothetical protein
MNKTVKTILQVISYIITLLLGAGGATVVMGTGTWVWVPVFMAIFLRYS